MKRHIGVSTWGCTFAALLALLFLQGCTLGKQSVGQYLLYRAADAAQILELGVTVSTKPQFALYADGVSVACGGYGNVDGYFIGLGGGQLGVTRFYEKSLGLFIWGQETVGWGDYDVSDPSTLNTQGVGVLGIFAGPHGLPSHLGIAGPAPGPDYMPACAHYLHLGVLGVVANARYFEMLDFLSGWFFVDLSGDDGQPMGHYPWQAPRGGQASVTAPAERAPGPSAPREEAVEASAIATPERPPLPAVAPEPPVSPASGRTYTVVPGDTLWGIATKAYGDGTKWKVIYDANSEKVASPSALRVGTVLAIP